MNSFAGKAASVTGGEIECATVHELLRRGAAVVALDLDESAARTSLAAADGRRGLSLGCDVRDLRACEHAMESTVGALGRLDIVVNSVGVIRHGSVEQLALEDWLMQLDTNLGGVFHICRAAISRLRAIAGGAIVNVAPGVRYTGQGPRLPSLQGRCRGAYPKHGDRPRRGACSCECCRTGFG